MMKLKWLMVLAVLLFLLTWTAAFAGPKSDVGHGDDDIPELMKSRTGISIEKILDSLDVESLWNGVFRVDQGKLPELGNQQGARRAGMPATRRYPVRSK
jgi:hypothetical protein